ncbi:hypothetical protein [Micromonospora sp. NPDC004704]
MTAVDPSDTGKPISPSLHQSLPEAVEHCLRYLGSALRAGVPADPAQPLRIPQQPAPVDELTDPETVVASARPDGSGRGDHHPVVAGRRASKGVRRPGDV